MAKKKQDLTPEERLAAALVPEEEWPYALPDGWKWVYWGKCGDFIAGTGFPKLYQGIIGEKYPFYKVGSLRSIDADGYLMDNQHSIDDKILLKIKAKKIEPNSIVFAKIGEAIKLNRRGLTKQVCCVDNNMMAFQADKNLLDYHYVYYWSTGIDLYKYTNATTVPAIRKTDLEKIVFPLPPLSEQHRLVARIESLFAKLDAAREKVQSVLDSHETRKAALLHAAFTGKLTAKWREEQGESSHAWRIEKLENLCEKITCGKTPKNDISPQGEIPYLKVYNIVNDKIDFRSKPQYISRDVHETKLKSSILKPNDVIMNIVGPPLRKIAIIPDTYPEWNMNQAIVRFRPKEGLDYHFLYYALLNPETLDDVVQRTKGVVGQANISITQSRNLKIKVPPLPEQQEIIRILDRLLAREQRARQAAEETLAAIDRMKQSILARAFRGEL
ncbi:restriction endonuclease subunit S [Selenomonas bovis]|uniref:restriction endonuclease subunit S n=1 Tax=Selenomonas bovis TaxID=416586 RepID=UPI003D07CC94